MQGFMQIKDSQTYTQKIPKGKHNLKQQLVNQ